MSRAIEVGDDVVYAKAYLRRLGPVYAGEMADRGIVREIHQNGRFARVEWTDETRLVAIKNIVPLHRRDIAGLGTEHLPAAGRMAPDEPAGEWGED